MGLETYYLKMGKDLYWTSKKKGIKGGGYMDKEQ